MNWSTSAPFGELLVTWRTRCNLTQTALATALGMHRNTISRWERGEGLPDTKGMVLELARLLRLNEQEARQLLEASLTALAPSWTVPLRRNPCFTGRETLLQHLHTRLTAAQPVALTPALALSGLGGIGKTQLAVEYTYRYALEYTAVFWLAAETAESLMASVQQIADQLQPPVRQTTDQRQMLAIVRRWLITHTGWLVIADNVEDLDLIQAVLPPTRQGALLVTTRRQTLGNLVEPLEVPPLKSEEGVSLLLQRAHRLGIPVAGAEEAAAVGLVALLEGLPLALDQAGAYIDETGCSVAEYLQLSRHQRRQMLARRGVHEGSHPASVTTTLRLAVERVEREYPAAIDLLRMCAFFHAEAIPEELFVAGASHLGPVLGPVVADPYQFNLVLAALRNASLVTRHPETRTLSVHRLVQAVLQDQMEPAEARVWSTRVVGTVNAAFPEPEPEFPVWTQCVRYLTHALACVPLLEQADELPAAGELLFKIGSYLMGRGHLAEAKPLLGQAVALGEKQADLDPTILLLRLLKQAELFWRQGMYSQAEQLVQRSLTFGEHHLGPTHRQIAEILDNLAILYCDQGKYEQAEPLYLRALGIYEQEWGSDHPETGMVLNNLALLYRRMGKYQQAESLYMRSLQMKERQLGPEHPRTVVTLSNLALLCYNQGKYEQAEELYIRALPLWERAVGPEHPSLAHTLAGFADLCKAQGKYEQAEALYRRALHIWEAASHHQAASALGGLADLFAKQGNDAEAETLYQRALGHREQHLGLEHPQIAITLSRLASLYQKQGKERQAETLYNRALTICEQRLGSTHPSTVNVRSAYACLLEQRRKATATEASGREPKEHAPFVQANSFLRKKALHAFSAETPTVFQPENSPLHNFLADCCELHPQAWSRASDLWQAYERWAAAHQERFPLSRRVFTDQLKALGCRAGRTSTARLWRGITLVNNPSLTGYDGR